MKSLLYQDAGDGYGYLSSEWKEVRIEHRQGVLKMIRDGTYVGQPIRSLEIVGLTTQPKELRANGNIIEFTFDSGIRRMHAKLPENANEITLIR